jgi:hypothetical protein
VTAYPSRLILADMTTTPDACAPLPVSSPVHMARLEEAKTIDDVLGNLDRIIDWSIKAQSTIGYFAVLYRRSTLAVREAINEGQFDDGRRMEHFDAVFAQRYFNALNAYFYPGEYEGLTAAWEVSFVGHDDSNATMIQHMMTALTAHICFDLGVATIAVAPNSLDELEHDFNLITALVTTQIPGMLDVFQQLSPEFRRIRRVLPNKVEVALMKRILQRFRTGAWHFAIHLAQHPENVKERQVNQAAWTAALGAWYLQPPARWTPFPFFVRAIAKRESRDVAANLRALEAVRYTAEKRTRAFL